MPLPKPFTKVATVTFFLTLISCFVAYRSGLFDRYLYSTNGGNSLSDHGQYSSRASESGDQSDDTIPVRTMMSSSKSIILAEPGKSNTPNPADTGRLRIYIADSVWKKYLAENEKERVYMSSSKSGYVISPRHPARVRYPVTINGLTLRYTAPQLDSLLSLSPIIDTTSAYKLPQPVPDTPVSSPRIMPSTKSGGIFFPGDLKKKKKKQKGQ